LAGRWDSTHLPCLTETEFVPLKGDLRIVPSALSRCEFPFEPQVKDDPALVGLEDDLRFASLAHGPPEGAPEIAKAGEMAKLADRRNVVASGCGRLFLEKSMPDQLTHPDETVRLGIPLS
jgi:hypothetical protein